MTASIVANRPKLECLDSGAAVIGPTVLLLEEDEEGAAVTINLGT